MTIHTLLLFAQLAAPASTPVTTPTLGYTLVDHQIYAISGLPGAAAAVPVTSVPPVASLSSASHTPAAIALPIKADAQPFLITPSRQLPLVISGLVSSVNLSPSAQYAAILTSKGLFRLPLTKDALPEPIVLPVLPITQPTLTVSDFGAVLVTTSTELYYWPDPKSQPLHLAQALTSPRFAPHSNTIVALTADLTLILLDPATALTVQTFASARDGLLAPTALEIGTDNSAWVTQGSALPLLHISLTTRSVEVFTLSVPTLAAISPGVFLVDTLRVFDTNRPTPAVLLIPSVVSESTAN